jgi:hypothetical protein
MFPCGCTEADEKLHLRDVYGIIGAEAPPKVVVYYVLG